MTLSKILCALLIFFIASSAMAQAPFPAIHAIPRLIDPVSLRADTTRIDLANYIADTKAIDSATFSKGVKTVWDKKGGKLILIARPELKPLAEMKIWIKGYAYCVILRKQLKVDPSDPGKPIINTSKLGKGGFTIGVNYSRSPFSIACYWQNFKLGKGYLKRANEEMLITIPEEAKKIKRSFIRIVANDDVSRSNDILIPLEYGEVVNDPKQLESNNQKVIDSIRHSRFVEPQSDPVVAFLKDSSLATVAAMLKQTMERSAHYPASDLLLLPKNSLALPVGDPRLDIFQQVYDTKDSGYHKAALVLAFFDAIPGFGVDSSFLIATNTRGQKFKDVVYKLHKLRTDYLALSYGETDVAAKGDIMFIKRTYFSQTVFFVFNRSREKQSIQTGYNLAEFKTTFGHTTAGENVDLPPLSFEVLIK